MNANRKTMKVFLAAAAIGFALPGVADDRADFLRELARTDGNPHGDHAIPPPAQGEQAELTKAYIAFMRELARTDGNVAVEPVETPAETTVARR